MSKLYAEEYVFVVAPLDKPPASPNAENWFLFQVVPEIRGGGSCYGGYSGNELHTSAVETRYLGVWARTR